jgi:hypothetical protein
VIGIRGGALAVWAVARRSSEKEASNRASPRPENRYRRDWILGHLPLVKVLRRRSEFESLPPSQLILKSDASLVFRRAHPHHKCRVTLGAQL